MSRAAVEGYTGEGEPPSIVMTLRAVSDETTPPDLYLPITLTGVREQSEELQIHRPAEGTMFPATSNSFTITVVTNVYGHLVTQSFNATISTYS